MPESIIPILIPLPALATPPSAFHASGAFISCVARFNDGLNRRMGLTAATPGMLFNSSSRLAGAITKNRITKVTSEPVTGILRVASSPSTVRCFASICCRYAIAGELPHGLPADKAGRNRGIFQ